MTDDDIAMKLAQAMGWKKWDAFSEDKGWIEGDSVFIYHPSGIPDSPRFHPDTRWDHCGIMLDWMESQGKPIYIEENKSSRRIRFGENEGVTQTYGGKLTHQICEAALEAL